MTKQQHKKVLILEVIICILLFLWIIFMFLWLSKAYDMEIKHNVKTKYKVRWYLWWEYAFTLQKRLMKLGYSDNNSVIIINNCKKQGKLGKIKNVGRCIQTAWMIGYVESWSWKHCLKNNCLGLYQGRKGFKNKDEWFKDWVSRYVKYWRWYKKPYHYYWPNPITWYCVFTNMQALHNANYAYKVLNYNK